MVKLTLIQGDCQKVLPTLPDESVDCVMTSPPYWALRDYGVEGQLGLETTFEIYIKKLCDIFDEVKRILKKSGTCWVNLGDVYISSGETRHTGYGDPKNPKKGLINYKEPSGLPQTIIEKSLANIPARFSIEMQNRGWILRNVIIWHKPNCMPSSAKDRFTVDFEYIFFFVKSKKYYFETQYEKSIWADKDKRSKIKGGVKSKGKSESGNYAISGTAYSENGMKNKRTVWSICTKGTSEAHFATYPPELIDTPIKAGCPPNGTVLDPFTGSGTTGLIARKQGKSFIGIELNPKYIPIIKKRIKFNEGFCEFEYREVN